MKLKKLLPELVSTIIDARFDKEPRAIQGLAVPKIKSGADIFIISPDKSGKTTAVIIGIIQKLKKAFEEAPRAIILTSSKEKAFALEEQFELLNKHTKLRTFVAFDQGNLQYQKDEVYDGLDVLICTPKRLTELININGVPMTKVNTLVVDDAQAIVPHQNHSIIYRIADGIKNPQIIVSASKWHDKFDNLDEEIMKNPIILKVDDHD